jgi:DNA-binding NarL/FixJ family response regulator
MRAVSIALIDDHPLMVEAIVALLSRSGLQVLATGSSAKDLVELAAAHRPDVLIVDLNMHGDVYAAISTVAKKFIKTKIVTFTAATGVDFAIRALDAGAHGYVLKGSSSSELLRAIECVLRGETYITQNFASRVIAALRDTSLRRIAAEAVKLSIRENQILRLLVRGKTNKEIAASLRISDKTVKHYMTILMQKLHVRNRVEAVIAAQKFNEHLPQHESAYVHPTTPTYAS